MTGRRLMLAWWLWFLAIVAMVSAGVLLSGCAESRYLTAEEDAEMRAQCEPQPMGCAVLPMHQWLEIEKVLQRLGLQAS